MIDIKTKVKSFWGYFFPKATISKAVTVEELIEKSKSRNGYERQEAVVELGEKGCVTAIPSLLVRVNDWVEEVRVAAKHSLLQLLMEENSEAFVKALPAIYRLEAYTRENHSLFIEEIVSFLLKSENVKYLIAAMDNDDIYVARVALRLCLEHHLLAKDSIVEKCLLHHDTVFKITGSRLLCEVEEVKLNPLLEIAVESKFMPIRREAFQIYLQRFPKKGLEIAERFLFDRHYDIRRIAILTLTKHGYDVEKRYIDVLSQEESSRVEIKCSLLGLAKIDSKRVDVIKRYINDASSNIRMSALQSLSLLLGIEAQPYVLIGLADSSVKVAKIAVSMIQKFKMSVPVEELLDIYERSEYQHMLSICLSAVRHTNKWDRLIVLLRLFVSTKTAQSNKRNLIEYEVKNWDMRFNYTNVQPTISQINMLIVAYHAGKEVFTPYMSRSIDFTIRSLIH